MAGDCLFGVHVLSNPRWAASFAAANLLRPQTAGEDLGLADKLFLLS